MLERGELQDPETRLNLTLIPIDCMIDDEILNNYGHLLMAAYPDIYVAKTFWMLWYRNGGFERVKRLTWKKSTEHIPETQAWSFNLTWIDKYLCPPLLSASDSLDNSSALVSLCR
jgi:hypothetical protein